MSGLYASKVITWAKAQVGYHETGTNINKYAADMDKNYPDFFNLKKQGVEWCGVFVCDGFCNCYGEANALKMLYAPKKNLAAGCRYAANYYRNAKAWYSSPKKGDQIFFGTSGKETHTGLVIDVSGTTVYTIEGNKDNAVKQCSYKIGNSKISGYGRPAYDAEPTPTPTPTPTPGGIEVTTRTIYYRKGNLMKGQDVKSVQAIVGATQDGTCGAKTDKAIRAYQKAHGLTQDGMFGPACWKFACGAR